MNSIEDAKKKICSLIPKSKFEKMVYVTAVLTKLLENNRIRPVIVGGLAVEIYTRSDYTTVDIDVIVSDRKLAGDILVQLGFIPEGRHWYHEELMVSIEIPNDILEDADYEKIIELKLRDGSKVYVIGIEDIILDRLRACIHWKSTSDCEWGKRMFYLHFERIDLEYMRKKAKLDLTIERLEKWIHEYE
ncbi:hypothetical protein PB1_11019 [Bacillus methanolicus PB1]|uniref:DUF6036 domain-containing protein n=1 Tax=Bacillus methanolicus PB1 TaxID=997296 RepID=I3DV15_BACMT|nr:DUF6036 family nucleotidyltransferase [Bacillus methanolicus]EIJ78086.1 hypothetical protein PB1_11019 [Bacillus methanolicus PB1]